MRIKIESTILADPDPALGRFGPAGLSINGQQIVDEADIFRAAAPIYYSRGGGGVTLQFTVSRSFDTLAAAERFQLMHWDSIPREGLIICECGENSDVPIYLRNAVLEAVQLPSLRGGVVTVQYTIKGPFFESDIPEDEIPGEPDPGEEDVVTRRSRVAIAAAQTSVAVLFSSPLSSVPTINPTISRPAASPVITCSLREDSISIDGFTVDLSAETPDANYVLHYIAIE